MQLPVFIRLRIFLNIGLFALLQGERGEARGHILHDNYSKTNVCMACAHVQWGLWSAVVLLRRLTLDLDFIVPVLYKLSDSDDETAVQ